MWDARIVLNHDLCSEQQILIFLLMKIFFKSPSNALSIMLVPEFKVFPNKFKPNI